MFENVVNIGQLKDKTFDKSEFQEKLRIDKLIEKEKELWERVKKFGRD